MVCEHSKATTRPPFPLNVSVENTLKIKPTSFQIKWNGYIFIFIYIKRLKRQLYFIFILNKSIVLNLLCNRKLKKKINSFT